MKQWEHEIVQWYDFTNLIQKFDELGNDGWELIAVTVNSSFTPPPYHAFFKREVQNPT